MCIAHRGRVVCAGARVRGCAGAHLFGRAGAGVGREADLAVSRFTVQTAS